MCNFSWHKNPSKIRWGGWRLWNNGIFSEFLAFLRLFLWFSNIVRIGWIYLMKEGIYHACNDHQHKEENPGRDYYLTLLLDKSWWTLLPSGEISESNWKMCCKRARSALTTDSVMRSLRPWCAKEMKGLFSSFCARRKRQLVATNKCFYTITEHQRCQRLPT